MAKRTKSKKPPNSARGTTSQTENGSEPKRRRSWLRRTVVFLAWTVGLVLIAAGVGLWVVTRSWFIISQVQPELERRLGGPVQIAEAGYEGGGSFVFRGVVIRAPGHGGAAGRLGQIDRVELKLNPLRMLKGSESIQSIRLEGTHLRLAEDARQPGEFNFMSLHPDWSTTSPEDGPTLPPRVEISKIQVELGTDDQGQYERIGLRHFSGTMHPDRDAREWYLFELNEINPDGTPKSEPGLTVKGKWNVTTNAHEYNIEGLTLDDRTYAMCPQIVRDWWDRMELEGRVSGVAIHWQADAPLSIEAGVEDVALTIPVDTQDIWARYRDGFVEATPSRPRMRVKSGKIKLVGDHLSLNNQGELGSTDIGDLIVGVPFNVELNIPALPAIDWKNREQWFEQALSQAAFDMTFRMKDFTFESQSGESAHSIDLPKVVAEALERFRMKDWSLSTEVVVHRGPPVTDENGVTTASEIESHGQAIIQHATCTYVDFPYPLADVDAFLQFNNNNVKVQYLYGLGSENTRIRLSGDIKLPSETAEVHLVLTAENVPIDGALRKALKPDQAKVFDALIHEPSRIGLADAGMLIDDVDIKDAEARRESVLREMTALKNELSEDGDTTSPDEVVEVNPAQAQLDELRLEIARLDRLIHAGPFQAGGHVDLNLSIDRESGFRVPAYVTGTMNVHNGGLIYELFPYPLSITSGTFVWEKDRIKLVGAGDQGGVTFVTPAGGKGVAGGEIVFPQGTGKVEPRLVIKVTDDRINDALLAAIPPGREEAIDILTAETVEASALPADFVGPPVPNSSAWPGMKLSRAASMLQSTGLRGALDYQGLIEPDANGRINFEFVAEVQNGSASPGGDVSSPISEAGLYWPSGFAVHDVSATLRVSRDVIELKKFVGRHDHGEVSATGLMDLTKKPTDISITAELNDLMIGDYLIDLAPQQGVARARELWERYQPSGSFNATLQYISNAERAGVMELQLHPKKVQAIVEDQTVEFARREGRIDLHDNQVTFNQLLMDLSVSDAPQGELLLSGTYGMIEGDDGIELVGQWRDGRLESPIVTEAMTLFGGEAEAEHLRQLQLAGAFDAAFRYRSPRGTLPREYELSLRPRSAELTVEGQRVAIELDGGGEVTIRPGMITGTDLRGALGEGSFDIAGVVRTDPKPIAIDVSIDYQGKLSSEAVIALLPEAARESLAAIQFSDGDGSRLQNGRLHLRQVFDTKRGQDDSPGEKVELWAADFRGLAITDSASFVGGVSFEQVNGAFDISVQTEPGQASHMAINANVDSLQAYGCPLTDCNARIYLAGGNQIRVDDFRAEMCSGAVSGRARFGVDENYDYEATISLAGIELGEMLSKSAGETASARNGNRPPTNSGEMYANVAVQGERGRLETQTGRGFVRIADGRMARMPFLLGVLQLMEFMPPLSDALDFADIEFYIEGSEAIFSRMVFECPTLQLHGEGGMNLDTMDVNVLFRSKGTVALLDDLIGGLNDGLFGISVTGPLKDPVARLVPLPGLSSQPQRRNVDWSDEQRKITAAAGE